MKLFKKALSLLLSVMMVATMFLMLASTPVSAAVAIPEGYEIDEQTVIDFNTDGKGWSDTNGTIGTHVTQVTDADNSANKYIHLYTPNGNGYNIELASGSDSSTAYEMVASTKYSIEFKLKVIDAANTKSNLNFYFGTKAGYISSITKVKMKAFNAGSYNDGEWHTVSYSWTTTETMTDTSYNSTSTKGNICSRMYLVAADSGTAATWAIDDIVITKYKEATPAPKNEITYINFNTEGKGWSDTNGPSYLTQVNYINNTANKYIKLYTPNGDGYNMELAAGSDSDTAYTLEPSTTYTLSFKLKPIDSTAGRLSLYYGSRAAAGGGYSKYSAKSWAGTSYTQNEWSTVSFTFTTTDTMTYASYKGSGATNVCDRLYLVAQGNENTWGIDDVQIKKHVADADGDTYVGGIAPDPNEQGDIEIEEPGEEETEKEMYEILDFTHEPYKTYAAPGKHSGVWYCSLRWSTYTEDDNSVMRYKFEYDISENAPNTSGVRGTTAKGTNGGTSAAMCLVPTATPSTPITVTQGKSYRVSFKYKVIAVELNSFVSFGIMRGKYSSGWTSSYGPSSSSDKESDRYIMAVEYSPTEGWVDATYTFTANYTTNTEFDKLQIGGKGYGEALIDAIVIEEIDASEVEPVNSDSANYIYSTSGNTSTITSYKAKATDLTITHLIGRRQLVRIDNYAFLYNRYTKNIIIENGPTSIGTYAFEYAKVLETISIPKSITSIEKGAFYGIKTMKAFTVDADNPNYASADGVLYTKDMKTLLYYPAGNEATSFTVPDTVTTIAEGAFLNAVNLQTITLPEGLTTIERRAFMNCTALTTVNFPASVTSVGSSAFRNCAALIQNVFTVNDSVDLGVNVFADSGIFKAGDIEGNDGINLEDATYLARYLAGWEDNKLSLMSTLAADINADGKVDMLDAVLFKRHLADWNGYDALPFVGADYESAEYTTDSTTPELIVNVSEKNTRKVTTKRDIDYDPNKEDIIMILITGQSNSGTGGYKQEYTYKYGDSDTTAHPSWEITAEPTRPEQGTVFFDATVTALNDSNDVYFNTDAASLGVSTMGGYSPAMGKALHDATGAKIVFIQASKGAVGMHEWTPEPEKYECPCGENGGGKLYAQAIANFTKSYQALEDDYNIIATAYVYNQGEHEELSTYVTGAATVHDDQGYYDALVEMHEGFLSECEIDCGGVFMPRSWYSRYGLSSSDDIPQNSRRPSIARAAQYAAAQKLDNFFVFSNVSEEICKAGPLKPDPTNSIHYGMAAYNAIGAQNADSVAKYFGFTEASEFTGITVFNKIGAELCAFDVNGNLVSGSDVIAFSSDNSKLYIRVNPTGSMYTVDYSSAGTATDFVDDYGIITAVDGAETFKIVINMPVK